MASSNKSLPDNAQHLLVIDDDSRIRSLLQKYLTNNGYRVSAAQNAAEARKTMAGLSFDLLILDVMMPGETGMEFASSLRETDSIPILMLTARAESESRIQGLEIGVDDYLPKPFEPRELLLRIRNILKHHMANATAAINEVNFGPFQFKLERQELLCGDDVIRLTDRERELLALFASQPGATVTRAALAGEDGTGERTVDVQINRLRRKIEPDPSNPIYLQTIRGIGYRLLTD
ncbi:two-component system, OmpR family, phosphate regulon response regulator OmpR [Cohaesibacter gelatinilyticus]|uniref:Two-component system, OmpR family, phosphate regulon response regulator OmpR n=2 Tax=Cohaesibacter gelatinilyticus TaxID=372072 RepID=A0A285PGP2_9HYPH|nr:response regulator transcription factor [Cohaesibacter gelatinilyticus]SNZ20869.1 two-component system, OmpR family, phosphate regulon response regulator OmpR [Cohaesibacter gelatinilyticus]